MSLLLTVLVVDVSNFGIDRKRKPHNIICFRNCRYVRFTTFVVVALILSSLSSSISVGNGGRGQPPIRVSDRRDIFVSIHVNDDCG
jgi:hypothetical protein